MNDRELQKYIGEEDITVVEAMKKIDWNSCGVLYIIDKSGKLTGSLTDGDIRRWIIKTGDLTGRASQMQNRDVKYASEDESKRLDYLMKSRKITSIPVVDKKGHIKDIVFLADQGDNENFDNHTLSGIPIIIMAGGKGTRLYPYTKILPKPLIPIGDIPILERILNRFCEFGAHEFYLTVNYKKEMIKSYFNDLKPDYILHYVEEEKPLGTAGSIRLIEKRFDTPVFITNCDILIEEDYGKILEYHRDSGNALTVVSSLKNIIIPYGVLHSQERGVLTSIEEKPQLSYFINTGMYLINPQYLDKIPDDTFYHMTNLAEQLMEDGCQVGMYPVSENSFLDMGEFEEMKRMEELLGHGIDVKSIVKDDN